MQGGLILFAIFTMIAVWRWTPLADYIQVETLQQNILMIKGNGFAPTIAISMIILGGLVGIPITLIIIAILLVFGPLLGFVYAIIGSTLSSVCAYLIGRYIGRKTLRQIAGSKLNQISQQIAKQGVITIILVRLIPIAPFVVVNLIAGASHIKLRDFVFGSALGLMPGTIGLALITNGVINAADEPNTFNLSIVIMMIAVFAVLSLGIRQWLVKNRKTES